MDNDRDEYKEYLPIPWGRTKVCITFVIAYAVLSLCFRENSLGLLHYAGPAIMAPLFACAWHRDQLGAIWRRNVVGYRIWRYFVTGKDTLQEKVLSANKIHASLRDINIPPIADHALVIPVVPSLLSRPKVYHRSGEWWENNLRLVDCGDHERFQLSHKRYTSDWMSFTAEAILRDWVPAMELYRKASSSVIAFKREVVEELRSKDRSIVCFSEVMSGIADEFLGYDRLKCSKEGVKLAHRIADGLPLTDPRRRELLALKTRPRKARPKPADDGESAS